MLNEWFNIQNMFLVLWWPRRRDWKQIQQELTWLFLVNWTGNAEKILLSVTEIGRWTFRFALYSSFLVNFKFPVEHLTSRGDGHIIRADNFPLQIWDNPPSRFLSTLKGFLKQQAIRRFLWHAYSGLDEQCINSVVG